MEASRASSFGYFETIKYLLKHGADVNAKNNNGKTALDEAIDYQAKDFLRRFIEGRATFLDLANNDELVELYKLQQCMHPNGILLESARIGDLEKVKECLTNGANVNAKSDLTHKTALIKALNNNHFEIAKYLVKNGADVNPENGEIPLIWASENGHFEIVKFLVENGADVNIKNNYNYTALKWALLVEHREIVKFLVAHGAIDSNTPEIDIDDEIPF